MKTRSTHIMVNLTDGMPEEELDRVCQVFELLYQWDQELSVKKAGYHNSETERT